MLLIALAVLVLVRVDWRHMNSFHYLILFLLVQLNLFFDTVAHAALVKHA